LESPIAKSRMLRDVESFKARIGSIDGAGDTGDYLINLVKGKSVPETQAPVTRKASSNGINKTDVIPESKPEPEESKPPDTDAAQEKEKEGA